MKKFIRKYGLTILLVAIVLFVTSSLFFSLHEYATAWRGYNALGGEMFVFAIPFVAYVVYRNMKDSNTESEDDE